MNFGDTGEAVKDYQASVGLLADGICGNDTYLRWRADYDSSLPWMLVNGAKLIGIITQYSMASVGPTANDCSGFVDLALGIPKSPTGLNHTGKWLNTDNILGDAYGADTLFHDIKMDELRSGDLVCYGAHNGHVGHIAFVVDPSTHLILDCSGSRNGAHCHIDDRAHFWNNIEGRKVQALRYVGPING